MANEIDTKIQQCETDIQKLQDTLKELKTQKDVVLYNGMRVKACGGRYIYSLFSNGNDKWSVAWVDHDKINFAGGYVASEIKIYLKNGTWIKD